MACSCSPFAAYSIPTPPKLVRDPGGRLRVLEASRNRELSRRRDLAPPSWSASRPPCGPPHESPARQRPECEAREPREPREPREAREGREAPSSSPSPRGRTSPSAVADEDCKCPVKGACKKVRFSDEVLAAEPKAAAESAGERTRVEAPAAKRPRDGQGSEAHDCATHRERDNRPSMRQQANAPCDCPCWSAFSAHPPASLATGDIYRTCKLPKRFQYPAWFSGYNTGPKHPLYRTTSSEIGRFAPTVHTVTTIFRPVDRSLSKIYAPAGPWRNRSLCNTGTIWDIYSYNNFY